MGSFKEERSCFSVNLDQHGQRQADWQFGDYPGWSISEKEGVRWESAPLTQEGYEAILAHFKISEIAKDIPFAQLQSTSPANLQLLRKFYESGRKVNTRGWDPASHRRGYGDVTASGVH